MNEFATVIFELTWPCGSDAGQTIIGITHICHAFITP